MSSRVIHFELVEGEPDKASEFYGKLFGWETTKWDGPLDYWLIGTGEGPGIDGAFMKPERFGAQKTIVTIGVDSIDETLAAAVANGGQQISPKVPIPGVGHFAYIADPEGVLVGVMQLDPSTQA